jgi:manganese transport protein
VFSQVLLSLQLPFAVIPLVMFVSDKRGMGRLAIGRTVKLVAWPCAALITVMNLWLLWQTVVNWL